MLGLMQNQPLLISSLIEHAATFHPRTEIVSRLPEGPVRRTTWGDLRQRAKQVANALTQLGVQQGDRVGTLAWNSDRHLALYYGVSGSGAGRGASARAACRKSDISTPCRYSITTTAAPPYGS